MRTAEEFYTVISEYVSTLKGKNGDKATKVTQDKRTSILKGIVPVLIAHGHNEPDEKDYEIYRASQNTSPATVNEYTKKIRVFFEWDRKKKITTPTTDETDILEATVPEPVQATDDNTHTEPIRNKGGRKRYDTKKGEKAVQWAKNLSEGQKSPKVKTCPKGKTCSKEALCGTKISNPPGFWNGPTALSPW